MDIVYFDNHLVVVKKIAGIPTQDVGGSCLSLEKEVKRWLKHELNKPKEVFLHPVHRLDKEVSGLVLFAKTSKALSRLNEAMRERKIKKTYMALVEGNLKKEKDRLVHYLLHGHHKAEIVHSHKQNAKKAVLEYELIEKSPLFSLVKIRLFTGRYHQIRAQFSDIGHPIVGDEKYHSTLPCTYKDGIFLHHFSLEFIHPVTRQPLYFEAPFPIDWRLSEKALSFL